MTWTCFDGDVLTLYHCGCATCYLRKYGVTPPHFLMTKAEDFLAMRCFQFTNQSSWECPWMTLSTAGRFFVETWTRPKVEVMKIGSMVTDGTVPQTDRQFSDGGKRKDHKLDTSPTSKIPLSRSESTIPR